MTESLDASAAQPDQAPAKKRTGGLNSMLLADLKAMAGGMGIAGANSLKKAQLIDAIKAAQSGQGGRPSGGVPDKKAEPEKKPEPEKKAEPEQARQDKPARSENKPETKQGEEAKQADDAPAKDERPAQQPRQRQNQPAKKAAQQPQQDKQDRQQDRAPQQAESQDTDGDDDHDDGEGGARRNRRRRGRDRNRTLREQENEVREDDVLVPAAGILDVLDNYAFVRTSGYLAGVDDVYLSLSLVRKYGLRRGDAVAGQVRQPRDGERREKFNPMVRIDAVNGADPELAKNRPDFATFVPTHPTDRLRMETTPDNLTGRVLDLAAPIGKGQRGLVSGPTKSGRTTLLRSIGASLTANNPEAHLMVVLLDERPEEVTDFQRAIKGEVVASTFDRPALDHVTAAELAVERAKRLVELGHDVIVLFDGLTRLGRAYNLAGAANGRVATGGVEATALYGLKRLFGSARNVDNGGSLTIIATVVNDSTSAIDQLLFEEIDGTENLEIRLRRDLAEERAYPAIDVVASGTRHADLLTSAEEQSILSKLDAELAELTPADAHRSLLERLGRTRTNIEFLMGVQRG
ncbi:MAG TPA: transcription termination factor Rho [Nocardioides sp.]|nr:transcription termination factor Rho [Nocardioides sp.]